MCLSCVCLVVCLVCLVYLVVVSLVIVREREKGGLLGGRSRGERRCLGEMERDSGRKDSGKGRERM